MVRSPSAVLVVLLLGCSSGGQNDVACSRIKSVGVSGSAVESALLNGTLPAGWGGVLDLMDKANPSDIENAKRQRCTVHMDMTMEEPGSSADPMRLAFWTAEHCIKFANMLSAELNVFDPTKKQYIRFPVRIDEFDRFLEGKKLFERHASTRLPQYLAAAARPSSGLIARGIPSCKTDSQQFLIDNPSQSVICSSVLDLVRLEGRVHEAAIGRSEVTNLLTRMSASIRENEREQFVNLERFSALLSQQQMEGMRFWLTNWRPQVSKLSQLRGLEGFAPLIEDLRTECSGETVDGLCHPEIKAFFANGLREYRDAGATGSFLEFLQDVINAPIDGENGNLAWLLSSQRSVEQYLQIMGAAFLGTNFALPSRHGRATHGPTDTLGTKGPLFYASAPLSLIRSGAEGDLRSSIFFKDRTILYGLDRGLQQGENFFMQPGDSGSVVVVGNMPIGVVSTVNGAETSGGSAVLPLPEDFDDQEVESAVNSKRKPKGGVSTCK